jgi:hypothetical protein
MGADQAAAAQSWLWHWPDRSSGLVLLPRMVCALERIGYQVMTCFCPYVFFAPGWIIPVCYHID